MIESQIKPEELDQILLFLSKLDLFKNLSKEELQDLTSLLKMVAVEGKEILIQQGSSDTTLYILYEGRLRVSIKDPNHPAGLDLADISPGEIVGEISILIQTPRTATVKATRDSILFKLDQKSFDHFQSRYPDGVMQIAKTALKRVVQKPRETKAGENVSIITIVPAGQSNHIPFCLRLAEELNRIHPTLHVNKESCNRQFGRDIANAKFGEPDSAAIQQWLLDLEGKFRYLILETDREMTFWTARCLRHADRMLFIADVASDPALGAIEKSSFAEEGTTSWKEIVFLHKEPQIALGTSEWLKNRFVNNYHHVHLPSGLAKICRFLTGNAFGVVLSGGGFRGVAHAGVLMALEKLGLQIDFLGGTSMGAVIGASYIKFGVQKTVELCRYGNLLKLINDYTLPLVSLIKGKRMSQFLETWSESAFIEDLWTRYFCISTNVSQLGGFVHKQGILWRALRATSSVPGLFPPVYDEEGNMLVDGGIVNNLPVEVMRDLIGGGKILAVDCIELDQKEPKRFIADAWVSGWKIFFERFNPFSKKKEERDYITDILRTCFNLSSLEQEKRSAKKADYILELDLGSYNMLAPPKSEDLVDIGYKKALEKLPKILGL